jgi:hypothetical protein
LKFEIKAKEEGKRESRKEKKKRKVSQITHRRERYRVIVIGEGIELN